MKRTLKNSFILLLTILLLLSAGSVSGADSLRIGDVDGDGELTAQDANCVTRHLANFDILDAAERSVADFDGDGVVTAQDASLIMSSLIMPEEQPKVQWSTSLLVTSDLSGMAWGTDALEQRGACSVLNIATYVAQEREKDPNILLIDAGGSLYGSTIADEYEVYTEKSVGPMTAAFTRIGYNAVLLGDEALTYPSYRVRNEMDRLTAKGTAVIGTNLIKAHPTMDDPAFTPWNDILPYTVLETPRGEEEAPLRIGIVGLVDPALAEPTDEVKAADPISSYERIAAELRQNCDLVILLYHGQAERDETRADSFSVREFIRETSGIDFVLISHGTGVGSRQERNMNGREIPIVMLPDGPGKVLKLTVAKRSTNRFAYRTECVDMHAFGADEDLKKVIRSYVNAISVIMDATVCTLEQSIEPHAKNALGSTDGMELLHEMQIWAAKTFISDNGLDLPSTVLSIAYPYFGTKGLSAGALRYRDICALNATIPKYTLLMVRGEELRAWLRDYTAKISEEESVYSLYGLSYLLNTWSDDMPLGFLEYSTDVEVEDDDVFTVILAEDPDGDAVLMPYLDETWMPYADRVVDSFRMPDTKYTETSEHYAAVTPLVAFLEQQESFSLRHESAWLVI